MSKPGRKLSEEEAQIWAQVARTVTPLERRRARREVLTGAATTPAKPVPAVPAKPTAPPKKVKGRVPPPLPPKPVAPPRTEAAPHLDGSWEKRISRGTLVPDFSLDLHGSNLDQAYMRLMHGLSQAKAMGARVVLVVTGKARQNEAMDRGERRGAIRAKLADWLSASEHASDVVALRGAHRRHGGPGALYIVLKRRR